MMKTLAKRLESTYSIEFLQVDFVSNSTTTKSLTLSTTLPINAIPLLTSKLNDFIIFVAFQQPKIFTKKNLLFIALALFAITSITSCGEDDPMEQSKERTLSYEVDGELISFTDDDVYLNSFFGIFSISATDATNTTSATHSVDITWIETPTAGMYSDTSGVSTSFVYNEQSSLYSSDNINIEVTENSDDFFRASFSWDEQAIFGTMWEIRNGEIVFEK